MAATTAASADPSTTDAPALSVRRFRKSFGGPNVVQDVDFDLQAAEVHAIVGENGAGKSTLLKLIAGVHQPDGGELFVDGRQVTVHSAAGAQAYGVALIFQEPALFPDLSVAENIFMGRHPVAGTLPIVRWKAMEMAARRMLDRIGAKIDPARRVGELSVAEQQQIEIAAALSRDARIVLMDEPTASLTPQEVSRLFEIIRGLKERGATVVFVNHRLDEVFAVSDRITVMRDGAKIGTFDAAEVTQDDIIRRMVGRDIDQIDDRPRSDRGEVALEVEAMSHYALFQDISFQVREGEIVALAGLVGAGRTEVARAIFGIDKFETGTVRLHGRPVRFPSPREALDAGVAYLPEDRQHQGLVLQLPVSQNISLSILRELTRAGWLQRRAEAELARREVGRLRVKTQSIATHAQSLSGGNQQKLLVGKYLVTQPKVLILDEPTRGVDVGSKSEIHRLIGELAAQGLAILMISSDLPEVLAMADRVLVMREGSLVARLAREEATEEAIMTAAVGTSPASVGRDVG